MIRIRLRDELLVLAIIVQLRARNEIGVLEFVILLPGFFDLVQPTFFCNKKATVGQQTFVNRTELVDTELGIGDATAPLLPPSSLPSAGGEGQQVDNSLQDLVAEFAPIQRRRAAGIEKMALQRRHVEGVMSRALKAKCQIFFAWLKASEDEVKKQLQGFMKIKAVLRFRGVQRHHLQFA
jgi:hypothetical protein